MKSTEVGKPLHHRLHGCRRKQALDPLQTRRSRRGVGGNDDIQKECCASSDGPSAVNTIVCLRRRKPPLSTEKSTKFLRQYCPTSPLWKMDAERQRSTPSSSRSGLQLLSGHQEIRKKGQRWIQRLRSLSGVALLLCTALLLQEFAVARAQPVPASPAFAGDLHAAPQTRSGVVSNSSAQSQTVDNTNDTKEDADGRPKQAAAMGTQDSVRSAISRPITTQNFFMYYKHNNAKRENEGNTATNPEAHSGSSRDSHEREATKSDREGAHEEETDKEEERAGLTPRLRVYPSGQTPTQSRAETGNAVADTTAPLDTAAAAVESQEAEPEAAEEADEANAEAGIDAASEFEAAAEAEAAETEAAEAATAAALETGAAVEAESAAAAEAAAEAEAVAEVEAAAAAEAAAAQLAAQGLLEEPEESVGRLAGIKEEEVKASLQDIAALTASATAFVAAVNNGRADFAEAAEASPEGVALLGGHEAAWRSQVDAEDQPPMEQTQKVAQMVQEAREDDLGVFDPVDSTGKKTIILQEWYTTTVASTMVGRRETDEDALLVGAPSAVRDDVRFKAIFDGHGGEQTADFCADNVSRYLGVLEDFSFRSIKEACLRMDADVLDAFGHRGVPGSTGVIAIIEKIHTPRTVVAYGREIVPDDLAEAVKFVPVELQLLQEEILEDSLRAERYIPPVKQTVTLGPDSFLLTLVNVGDSRAMLIHEDGRITRLSKDHKPNSPGERARIEKAGGFVSDVGTDVPRVDGILALSRAFGDSDFKAEEHLPPDQQRVIAVPDVRHFYVLPSDILVMACDGLFEPHGMDWKFLHDVAIEELRASDYLEIMVPRMMDYVYTMNSHDNISVIVTMFHREKFEKPTVIYRKTNGRGEVVQEAKLTDDQEHFPVLKDGIVSLH